MSIKIADLLPAPIEVPIGKGSLPFHGLGAQDIARLLALYKDTMVSFFAANGETTNFESMIVVAPEMVCRIIAMASDTEDQMADIARIPVSVQVECLEAIYRLSVPDEKKFSDLLLNLLGKIKRGKTALEAQRNSLEELSPEPSTSS